MAPNVVSAEPLFVRQQDFLVQLELVNEKLYDIWPLMLALYGKEAILKNKFLTV